MDQLVSKNKRGDVGSRCWLQLEQLEQHHTTGTAPWRRHCNKLNCRPKNALAPARSRLLHTCGLKPEAAARVRFARPLVHVMPSPGNAPFIRLLLGIHYSPGASSCEIHSVNAPFLLWTPTCTCSTQLPLSYHMMACPQAQYCSFAQTMFQRDTSTNDNLLAHTHTALIVVVKKAVAEAQYQ